MIQSKSGDLKIRLVDDPLRMELYSVRSERLLLQIPGNALLVPDFAGFCKIEAMEKDGELLLRFSSPTIDSGVVRIRPAAPGFTLSGEFVPAGDCELNALHILPRGTALGFYQLINFRNRHHTSAVWPELLPGMECESSTDSSDRQFAPHPAAMLLTAGSDNLFCGVSEPVAGSFGMKFRAAHYRLEQWTLEFGSRGYGLPLIGGKVFRLPEFRLFSVAEGTPFDCFRTFGEMLIREGKIPDPAWKKRFDWHRENVYCTWGDQCALAMKNLPPDVPENSVFEGGDAAPVLQTLNEPLVRRAAEIIRRERLPIRTILLDDGWQIARGLWEPHPERFPEMRKLVDDLHREGFRVVIWWVWSEITKNAEPFLRREHLLANGKRLPDGELQYDFSRRSTREEYLIPLFRRLFSSEPGCLDFDGIKTDFQMEKILCEYPPEDPAWRGEENYMAHLYPFLMKTMRSFKPDAVHIGCSGNYFLAGEIDINRTYDVANDDVQEHINRARMLEATAPGTPVVLDMHLYVSNRSAWLKAAAERKIPVHVGHLLFARDSMFTRPREASAEDWSELREELVNPLSRRKEEKP